MTVTWSTRADWQAPAANDGGVTWDKVTTSGAVSLRHGVNARRQRLIKNGVWNPTTGPVAIRHVGSFDRTYVLALTTNGSVVVSAQDHTSGDLIDEATVTTGLTPDDHTAQALCVLPNGKILCVYSTINGTDLRSKISTNAEDISAWGSEVSIATGTIPLYGVLRIIGTRVYCFYTKRAGSPERRALYAKYSDDNAATWSAEKTLITDGADHVYSRMSMSVSGRIDIGINKQDLTNGTLKGVWHGIFREVSGDLTLFASDNSTALGTWASGLPVDIDSMTQVYDSGLADDSGAGNFAAGCTDCALHGSTPELLLLEKMALGNRRILWARYDGGWAYHDVTNVGGGLRQTTAHEIFYTAGSCLDNASPGTIYVGKAIDKSSGGLYKYETANLGTPVWTETVICPATAPLNLRPFTPHNYHESLPLLWASGVYDGYTGHSGIASSAYATSIVCEPMSLAGIGFLVSFVMDNTTTAIVQHNQVAPRPFLDKVGGSPVLSAATLHGVSYLDFSVALAYGYQTNTLGDVLIDDATDATQIWIGGDVNDARDPNYFHCNNNVSSPINGQLLRGRPGQILQLMAGNSAPLNVSSAGGVIPTTPFMAALVNDGTTPIVKGYIDGVEILSGTPQAGDYLDRLYVGGGRTGGDTVFSHSDYMEAIKLATPKKLTAAELADIAALQEAGSYTSRWKSVASAGVGSASVEVSATIPAGTSAALTVYEDSDDDGIANGSSSVALSDGVQTYGLPGIVGGTGKAYRFKFEPSTTDRGVGASIIYVAISPGEGVGAPADNFQAVRAAVLMRMRAAQA